MIKFWVPELHNGHIFNLYGTKVYNFIGYIFKNVERWWEIRKEISNWYTVPE